MFFPVFPHLPGVGTLSPRIRGTHQHTYTPFPFIICLILMNYLMEFYFIGFVNAHLPGCFCPWTFRLNIGLNTSPSDSFVSYLNSHLGYSAGEFQALQLIVLAVFGTVD